MGRYEQALRAFQRGLRLEPDYAPAYDGKGQALCGLKRYTEALRAYQEGIALGGDYLAVMYTNLGAAFWALGMLEDALASYHQAITLDPMYAPAYAARGDAFRELRWYREALAAYERALDLNPCDSRACAGKRLALEALERSRALFPSPERTGAPGASDDAGSEMAEAAPAG